MDSTDKASIRERFLATNTANVADALDELGLPDQGLACDFAAVSGTRLAGWVYTITGQMVPYDGTGDERKMKACQGIGPGEVSVWSGDGHGVCYFGELIAVGMMQRGSVGSLVDGGLRDTQPLRAHGFAAFARYRTSVQSIGRWRVTDWQVPVYLHGATSQWVVARPGDFAFADEDGAIIVPAESIHDVLTRSETMTQTETAVRKALNEGMSLEKALDQFGHI